LGLCVLGFNGPNCRNSRDFLPGNVREFVRSGKWHTVINLFASVRCCVRYWAALRTRSAKRLGVRFKLSASYLICCRLPYKMATWFCDQFTDGTTPHRVWRTTMTTSGVQTGCRDHIAEDREVDITASADQTAKTAADHQSEQVPEYTDRWSGQWHCGIFPISSSLQGGPKTVIHYQGSSLNRIKNRQCGYISHQFWI